MMPPPVEAAGGEAGVVDPRDGDRDGVLYSVR